jgi:hypothetical protein
MIHPATELRTIDNSDGVGVVAVVPIPKGTVTWILDSLDRKLSRLQVWRLPKLVRRDFLKYAYVRDSGHYVLNWDNGRYQNHSCNPTSCLVTGLDFEIAIRDIPAGEQISSDYATYNLKRDLRCSCGAENCRGLISANDRANLSTLWTDQVSEAFQSFDSVEQPLWPLVADKRAVMKVIKENKRLLELGEMG